jgi:acyl transferase domain-containing protein
MGQRLYEEEPAFRDALTMCDRAMRPHLEDSLLTELLAGPADSRLDDVHIAQPAIFAIQVALAALWGSWGVRPAAVIGHSLGEVAAAHVAGALGLEDAARLICARARLLRRTSDRAARADLKDVLAALHITPAKVPMYSTVTGNQLNCQVHDDAHWMENLRSPVRFSGAVRRLLELGNDTFLEISPHPILLNAIGEDADDSGRTCVLLPSLRSDELERATMLGSLGMLYSRGQSVAWERLHPSDRQCVTAPTYPWQRDRFRLGATAESSAPTHSNASDQQERRQLLESYLRDHAACKLGLTPSLLDIESPLNNLGVDSLMAAELRAQIERDFGIVVPVVQLLDGPSVAGLADLLSGKLSGAPPGEGDPTVSADADATQRDGVGALAATDVDSSRWIDLLTQVPEVSDDDVDELLREVLAAGEEKR